ncbi:MAG: hypothetical protein IPL55_04040 [Saprospiraceae bacterium]|nr:hypothetical protein [Saprospiraceae bacterium]
MSYFKTIVQNSIDFVYLWNKSKSTVTLDYGDYRGETYMNIGKQTNQGLEMAIQSKVSGKLWITGNLSLISGKLDTVHQTSIIHIPRVITFNFSQVELSTKKKKQSD